MLKCKRPPTPEIISKRITRAFREKSDTPSSQLPAEPLKACKEKLIELACPPSTAQKSSKKRALNELIRLAERQVISFKMGHETEIDPGIRTKAVKAELQEWQDLTARLWDLMRNGSGYAKALIIEGGFRKTVPEFANIVVPNMPTTWGHNDAADVYPYFDGTAHPYPKDWKQECHGPGDYPILAVYLGRLVASSQKALSGLSASAAKRGRAGEPLKERTIKNIAAIFDKHHCLGNSDNQKTRSNIADRRLKFIQLAMQEVGCGLTLDSIVRILRK